MQVYQYSLRDSDYVQYLEGQASENGIVRFRTLLFVFGTIPVAALAVHLMGFSGRYLQLSFLLLFFLWIPWSRKMVMKWIEQTVRKKLEETPDRRYPEMKVSLDGRNISVLQNSGRSESRVTGYKAYGMILVLYLENGNQLIVPSRIFNEENKLADLLREIRQEG